MMMMMTSARRGLSLSAIALLLLLAHEKLYKSEQ